MSIEGLIVQIDGKEACLQYDTKAWTLSLYSSGTPAFQLSMNDVKKIYVSSSYKETHYEDKNKLARTVIGGALFGATGAIIGAVSGEGSKEIVDGKYSYIHIETNDREYVLVCKEHGIANSSRIFITNFTHAVSMKNDTHYRKIVKRRVAIFIGILIALVIELILLALDII